MSLVGGITKGSAYIGTDNLNCWYANITNGTTVLSNTPVTLYGININSHTSGTIKIWDGLVGNGSQPMYVALNTNTFAAAERFINLMGITLGTACTILVGGTADITIGYRKTGETSFTNNP